jgi:predicted transcriptional regulator
MQELRMKTAAIPAVRVSPELREAAEAVLESGETLSGFVEDAVRRNVEFRYAQKAFIERGLASRQAAKKSGKYVPAATVLGKLGRRLDKARKGRSGRTGAKPAA